MYARLARGRERLPRFKTIISLKEVAYFDMYLFNPRTLQPVFREGAPCR